METLLLGESCSRIHFIHLHIMLGTNCSAIVA